VDVDVYLSRLRLERGEPNSSLLRGLQEAHLLAVPFENRMCARATATGGIRLFGDRFVAYEGGSRVEREIGDPKEVERLLLERFGVDARAGHPRRTSP